MINDLSFLSFYRRRLLSFYRRRLLSFNFYNLILMSVLQALHLQLYFKVKKREKKIQSAQKNT